MVRNPAQGQRVPQIRNQVQLNHLRRRAEYGQAGLSSPPQPPPTFWNRALGDEPGYATAPKTVVAP